MWRGEARLPRDYFPPDVTLFNAYAIHGTQDTDRFYEALYESSGPQPDFHRCVNNDMFYVKTYSMLHTLKFRLEKFQPIDFSKILPTNAGSELSSLWRVSIEESKLLNKSDD